MGDYLDKETKQFLLIFAAICLFLFFVYPRISNSLFNLSLGNVLNPIFTTPTPNITPAQVQIDTSKDYTASIDTQRGTIQIDLFEKNAKLNVSNFVSLASLYTNADIQVQKDFLIKVDVKNEPSGTVKDEINADYLGLDRIKVKDATYLKDLYDPNNPATNVFSSENLYRFEDFSLKQFYATQLKYNYDPALTTSQAIKYVVYMASTGADQNKADFFILTANSAPQIDGRYTPIGRVTDGFTVIDALNNSGENGLKINKIIVSSK